MGKPIVVLRRRFDSAVSMFFCVAALVTTCYVLLRPWPGHGFGHQVEFIAFMAPLIWLMWMPGAHVAVKVYGSGVLVVNWFRRYWVPWTELASVESSGEVSILTRSGERIYVGSGASSLASSFLSNREQTRIGDGIVRSRPDPVPADESGVRKGFDLCLWQFGALVVLLLVVGWLGLEFYSPV